MLVGEPKFHSWGRCTIALTNVHSDLRFNPSSGLCIILYYVDPLFRILGCNLSFFYLSLGALTDLENGGCVQGGENCTIQIEIQYKSHQKRDQLYWNQGLNNSFIVTVVAIS